MRLCVSDIRRLGVAQPDYECSGLFSSSSSPQDSFAVVIPRNRTSESLPVTKITNPFQQLVSYTRDITNDAERRSNVVEDLLEEGSPQFSQMASSWAEDPQPLVRLRVARHLNRVDKQDQEALALKLQQDSLPVVRAQLAKSLRKIEASWTLSLLMALAEDPSKKVSEAASQTLLKTKMKALASLPASLRTREMQLGMMDLYLSRDTRWKSNARDILIRWGLMDEAIPKQMIAKYGDSINDAGLTVNAVRQKVESQLQGQDLSGLSAEALFALYKILEEVHVGRLPDIIRRKFSKTAAPYADLKQMVSFSPYLTGLLKGLEAGGSGAFMVSRSNPGEFRITLQIGFLAFLDLGHYRSFPTEQYAPQLMASQMNQVSL